MGRLYVRGIVKFIVELLVIGLVIGLMATQYLEVLLPWLPLLMASILLYMTWAHWLAKDKAFAFAGYQAKRSKVTYLFGFIFGGLLFCLYLYMAQHIKGELDRREAVAKRPVRPATPAFQPLSMEQLFRRDFDREGDFVMGLPDDRNIPWIDAGSGNTTYVRVAEQMILSSEANSYFMAFWIEPKGSAYTFRQCNMIKEHITDDAPVILQQLGGMGIETDAGKYLKISKNPIFSGQVYIYEWDLDIQQMAALEKAFKEKGATIVFRGQDYLRERNLQLQNRSRMQ